jgi:hypothetical protein
LATPKYLAKSAPKYKYPPKLHQPASSSKHIMRDVSILLFALDLDLPELRAELIFFDELKPLLKSSLMGTFRGPLEYQSF